MNTMQDFHNWLSVKEATFPNKHRFITLTRLSRVRLAEVSSADPWWIWSAEQPAVG